MKKYYKSKTLWAGVIIFVLGGVEAVRPVLPADWMPYALSAVGVLTILLRLVTNTGVSIKSVPDAK